MAEDRDMLCPECGSRVQEVHWSDERGVTDVACPTGCEMPPGWAAPAWWLPALQEHRARQR